MKHKDIINCNNRGVILLTVLSTILVVVALANIIVILVSSQSRLTQHQIGRSQAYYAAQAGTQYAIEMLRTAAWAIPAAGSTLTRTLCPQAAGCTDPNSGLPFTVNITVGSLGSSPNLIGGSGSALSGVAPITANVSYPTPP